MKPRSFLIAVILLSVFAWQCEENPLEPPTQREIRVMSSGFSPPSVTISRGESVVWTNVDNKTHSVDPGTFMNPTNAFRPSGNLLPGETSAPVTFTRADTINYYCSLHQENLKQGTIIVTN